MIFAQSLFDFGLQDGMLTIARAIAAIGGAIVGWFAGDLLTRLLYRISFKGATPGSLLLVAKLGTAATLAALIWAFLPIGGGGGGLGWGPGKGGQPGEGDGKGTGATNANNDAKNDKPVKDDKKTAVGASKLESVEIEIIDVNRFSNNERYKEKECYFLVKRAEPALDKTELEDYLKTNRGKIEVTPVLTKTSAAGTINPIGILLRLTKEYNVKTLQIKHE